MATIVNLTPHAVTVRTDAGDHTFPASSAVARVSVEMKPATRFFGGQVDLPVANRTCGEVVGLPAPDGFRTTQAFYIVSTMVFDAALASGRDCRDLLVPDSGPDAVRTAGPSATVKEALAALTENAEWAADGMPCATDMRRHVDVLAAALAAMPGQIQAVRRFVVA